jgi:16S rRNA (uracil1498-N3)-methyltransferase
VERCDRAVVAGLFWEGSAKPGDHVRLPEDAAHHAHVRRLRTGEPVRLADGRGQLYFGEVALAGRRELEVLVQEHVSVPRPPPLDIIVPIADRDRMLLVAEKAVELQITAWSPTHFARSRSVTPRGEGERFREKVRARMIGALEQSGAAWLPDMNEERDFGDVVASFPETTWRLLLNARGREIRDLVRVGPTAIAVGPEGGMEDREVEDAIARGWISTSLGSTTLRFETAMVAAVAIVRALQPSTGSV